MNGEEAKRNCFIVEVKLCQMRSKILGHIFLKKRSQPFLNKNKPRKKDDRCHPSHPWPTMECAHAHLATSHGHPHSSRVPTFLPCAFLPAISDPAPPLPPPKNDEHPPPLPLRPLGVAAMR